MGNAVKASTQQVYLILIRCVAAVSQSGSSTAPSPSFNVNLLSPFTKPALLIRQSKSDLTCERSHLHVSGTFTCSAPWKQIRQLGVGMQVSLLQFECIACALHDLPPTAPSSLEKFPPLFSPHASLQLRPSRQPSPSSSSSPCSASSSSSGCGRPWEPCGSPSSQVWRGVMVVPPLASPQAEPASPSSVLIIK